MRNANWYFAKRIVIGWLAHFADYHGVSWLHGRTCNANELGTEQSKRFYRAVKNIILSFRAHTLSCICFWSL